MKKPALHYFVDRMIGLVVITVLCLVGLLFYNSYKYLVWPHVPAVVTRCISELSSPGCCWYRNATRQILRKVARLP